MNEKLSAIRKENEIYKSKIDNSNYKPREFKTFFEEHNNLKK